MTRDGYAWWVARLRATLRAGGPGAARPLPRLRGLLGRPGRRARRPTNGPLGQGPGGRPVRRAAPGDWARLPLIAEDLGVITPEVEALRERVRTCRACGCCSSPSAGPPTTPTCRTTTSTNTRRLHRHARQRHHARLVRRAAATSERRFAAPLPGPRRRPGHRLGPDPAGLGVGGRLCHRPRCRTCSTSAARRG